MLIRIEDSLMRDKASINLKTMLTTVAELAQILSHPHLIREPDLTASSIADIVPVPYPLPQMNSVVGLPREFK